MKNKWLLIGCLLGGVWLSSCTNDPASDSDSSRNDDTYQSTTGSATFDQMDESNNGNSPSDQTTGGSAFDTTGMYNSKSNTNHMNGGQTKYNRNNDLNSDPRDLWNDKSDENSNNK